MKRTSNIDASHSAIALRIENEEFYLLGVRYDNVDYVLNDPLFLDREDMIVPDTRVGYMPFLIDAAKKNSTKKENILISSIRSYTRNGISEEDDKDIFIVSEDELSDIIDALRNGDYIFMME